MSFLIGADPELFLRNHENKLISAIGLIGGTKESPRKITAVGHAVQEDNVSVEFNIPPSDSKKAFVENINFVLQYLQGEAQKYNLVFSQVAAAEFDDDQLQTPEAKIFGCEPDYNAWKMCENPRPNAPSPNLRSCGGHVHVGTSLDPVEVVRAMDLFLGVPSVKLDSDTQRRQLYGKAGAFRFKSYGVEYRTLSNFWIWKDSLKEWVYDQTQKALEFVKTGNTVTQKNGKLIQKCINEGDADAYNKLILTYLPG